MINGHTNGAHHALEGEAIETRDSGERLAFAECIDCASLGPALPVGRRWVCMGCAQARINAVTAAPRMCCQRIKGDASMTGWCTKADGHDGECDGVRSTAPMATQFGPRRKQ